jgi:hypothetical protein
MSSNATRHQRWAKAALLFVLSLSACAGRDLDVLCEEATAAEQNTAADPALRALQFAQRVDERLSPWGDVRKIVQALAAASPEMKYQLLMVGAAETGHPEWRCPALERMFAPQTP